jgi:hypothetical protein
MAKFEKTGEGPEDNPTWVDYYANTAVPGVYYVLISATRERINLDEAPTIYNDEIETLWVDLTSTFGIIGAPYNQNYWMEAEIEVTTGPKVTAVQATDQAIKNVFPEVFADPIFVGWLRATTGASRIHDTIPTP